MKDLFKLKDEEFTEVQSQLVESESRAVRAKEDFEAMTGTVFKNNILVFSQYIKNLLPIIFF